MSADKLHQKQVAHPLGYIFSSVNYWW